MCKLIESSIKNLERKVGQLAEGFTTIAQSTSKSLPSQTEVNPQVRNVNAVHLRSGKYLGESSLAEKDEINEEGLSEKKAWPLTAKRARASLLDEPLKETRARV